MYKVITIQLIFGCAFIMQMSLASDIPTDTYNDNTREQLSRNYALAKDFYYDDNKDYEKAFYYFSKVVEYDPGTNRSNIITALSFKSGSYEKLGHMFHHGKGVGRNLQQALKFYKRSLILYEELDRHPNSMNMHILADKVKSEITEIENSLGIDKTPIELPHSFDLNNHIDQAQSSNLEAQNELGDYYYGTNYKFVNMPNAIRWYEKAAAQNHSSAIFSLCYIYELGKGVPVDEDKGESYFLRLGSKNQMSEIILAHLYETGRGREKNLDYALELYKKLPPEIAGGDVLRVQRKISQGSAIFGEAIIYQQQLQTPVGLPEQVTDSVHDIIETNEKTIPYAVLILLGGFVTVVILRKRSRQSHEVKNQTVSAAKILVEVGDHSGAREMLLEHLQNSPEDDEARALLQETVRID